MFNIYNSEAFMFPDEAFILCSGMAEECKLNINYEEAAKDDGK